ncbi:MAG TPA: hypothetical protein VHZ75_02245 [Solirubrobacteraceae bacterium]|jgi:hypothetical protein|nr:hypothetical protein [Solirubrobacteraceae bacterium]
MQRALRHVSVQITVLVLAGALCAAAATGAVPKRASGAHPVRACGTVRALGRTLRVDIADGRLPISCGRARGVIRHYLSATKGHTNGKLRHNGQTWTCFHSRANGVGWDYHCSYIRSYAGNVTRNYIDVGAGRR